jgi:hypothetical protein
MATDPVEEISHRELGPWHGLGFAKDPHKALHSKVGIRTLVNLKPPIRKEPNDFIRRNYLT